MADPTPTPISVRLLWLIAGFRALVVLGMVGITFWLAFPPPSHEWLSAFRAGFMEASGHSGTQLTPEALGQTLGYSAMGWGLTLLLPMALWMRSRTGVRWILGIHAFVTLGSAPIGLPLLGLMFALTLPRAAWSYWYPQASPIDHVAA